MINTRLDLGRIRAARDVTVVASRFAPARKLDRIRSSGAHLEVVDGDFEAARTRAVALASPRGIRLVEDSPDVETCEGAATIGKARRVANPDGTIGHAEIRVGDSVIMAFDARPEWPDMPSLLSVYVDDADTVVGRAGNHAETPAVLRRGNGTPHLMHCPGPPHGVPYESPHRPRGE